MILFKRISYKNFLSTGNQPIEIDLSISQTHIRSEGGLEHDYTD